jgi:hypothetical protein
MKQLDEFILQHKKDFSHEKEQATQELQHLHVEVRELNNTVQLLRQQRIDNEERERKAEELKHKCTDLISANHGKRK